MRLFNYQLPCGCEARKEIMFQTGGIGVPEAAIVAGAVVILIVAIKVNR